MSRDWVHDVGEFHELTGAHIAEKLGQPDEEVMALRLSLIAEEVIAELFPALVSGNVANIARECADAIYVIIGTCISYGIPLHAVWDEVHAANMSKADKTGTVWKRDDGKIIKPADWVPPAIEAVLAGAPPRPRCIICYRIATWVRKTQFAGNHHLCQHHAELQPGFNEETMEYRWESL